ncbi:glycosyl hydrolase [Yersinia pestis subsp. microtus bv. Altaica]|nr:glycosyl hydrolase [Yersinia pestis subsp. microtus bv. Altaica]
MVVMFKHLASMFLLLASFSLAAASNWPAWQQFKQDYISEGGRIIDPGSPSKITTSEGQSYGLFLHWLRMISRCLSVYWLGQKTIWQPVISLPAFPFVYGGKTQKITGIFWPLFRPPMRIF